LKKVSEQDVVANAIGLYDEQRFFCPFKKNKNAIKNGGGYDPNA
jgi:hypothetical protein